MSGPSDIEGTITSDDILGKDVIDHKGHLIGVSTQLHIEQNTKQLLGISIDCGFMRPFVFVGLEFIKTFGVDAIYITHTPKPLYMGILVFDRKGIKVGKITDAHFTQKQALKEIHVKRGLLTSVSIPGSYVKREGKNILLKIDIESIDEIATPLPRRSAHTD